MAATVSEVFPHTIPKIRIESKQGNEMSNLRTEFNEALGLIEGQPFFVATVTPRSFFKDAGDRRSSLKAGATIKKEDEQLECCTVIAAPSIHNRLPPYDRKRVVTGKVVPGRVDQGGSPIY